MALPGRAQAKLRMESTKLSGLAALGREESPSTFPLCIVLTFVFDSWHYQAHFCKKKKKLLSIVTFPYTQEEAKSQLIFHPTLPA